MRQVPAGNLIIGSEFERQRFPTLFQDARFFFGDRATEGVPARPPARRRDSPADRSRAKPFPKLLRFVQTPIVILIADLGVVRYRRGAAFVDEGKRTALAFEVILVPIENFRELRRFGRGIILHSSLRVHVSLREFLELGVELVRGERSRLSGGQLRLAQLSAKWTRGSLNFERIVSFSSALKLVCCPATVIRLPVKKVKSSVLHAFGRIFSERFVQNPGVVGVDVKSELLLFAHRGDVFLRDAVDHGLDRLNIGRVAFPFGILHSAGGDVFAEEPIISLGPILSVRSRGGHDAEGGSQKEYAEAFSYFHFAPRELLGQEQSARLWPLCW